MEISCNLDDFGSISVSDAKKLSVFASVSPRRRQHMSLKRINVTESIEIPQKTSFHYDNRSFVEKRKLITEAMK